MTTCPPQRLPAPLRIAGVDLVPDSSGALYWPDAETLVVADLHFEKGQSLASRGILLPPYDTRATLKRLIDVCGKLKPKRVVALGDSFHDAKVSERLAPDDAETLRGLVAAHDWIWIAGNHDPRPPAHLGGTVATALHIGPLVFRHIPTSSRSAADGELAGHFHPAASIVVRGRRFRRRCFASDGRRVILPAFGTYTGGLDLDDPAYDDLFGAGLTAWMLGERRAYPIPIVRSVSLRFTIR